MYIENSLKGKNRWWRWLLTLIFTGVGVLLGNIPFYIVIMAKVMKYQDPQLIQQFKETMDFSLLGLAPHWGLLLIMCPFIFGAALFLAGFALFHRRPLITLFSGTGSFRFCRFFTGAAIWLFFGLLGELAHWILFPELYRFTFNLKMFVPSLLMALVTIPIQAGFEELIFRGYLLQGATQLFKNRLIPVILSAVIFGALHIANPEIKNYGMGWMLPQYMIMGLFMALMTVMDDGLEMVWGVHVMNNLFGVVLVNSGGTAIQSPSVFITESFNAPFSLITLLISAPAILIIMGKIFRWSDMKRLFSSLDNPV